MNECHSKKKKKVHVNELSFTSNHLLVSVHLDRVNAQQPVIQLHFTLTKSTPQWIPLDPPEVVYNAADLVLTARSSIVHTVIYLIFKNHSCKMTCISHFSLIKIISHSAHTALTHKVTSNQRGENLLEILGHLPRRWGWMWTSCTSSSKGSLLPCCTFWILKGTQRINPGKRPRICCL